MRFEIRAVKSPAGAVRLALEAPDEGGARALARAQGYAVLDVRRKREPPFGGERFPLLMFSQELIALLDAGLPLVEALQTLAERHQDKRAHAALAQILERLYEGRTFSAALETRADVFPKLYIATVRASEKTGNLQQALSRYIAYQTQIEALRAKVATASIYPALLVLVGGAVTLFLLGYVVPKFAAIYDDIGRDQPLPSRLLMQLGALINQHGAALLAIGGVALAAAVFAASQADVRGRILARLARLPVIGERMRVMQLARFYRTAGMLLRGGVPVVSALEMVGGLLPPDMREHLAHAVREVREGQALSQAMAAHALTTPVALRMLRVGERTGEMGAMMERVAAFHDEEIARWIDRSMRLFEPLLMAFIGIIIGAIVLSLYMPIFELAGSLQ